MSWREWIRQLTLAGGAWTLAACGGSTLSGQPGQPGQPGVPCGNANPDPCICGRPDRSPVSKDLCDAKLACEASGGFWEPYQMTDSTGTTVPPHCEFDGGTGADAAPISDADSDGD